MKKIFYSILLLLYATVSNSQVAGDYRSTGAVDLNISTNWETYDGSSWSTAVTAPNAASLVSGNTITILTGHAWGNTLDATIPVGVTLLYQGTNGTFTAAKTITVNGTLEHNTTNLIPTTGLFIINGIFKHNTNIATVLSTGTTYSVGSTINIVGCVSSIAQLPSSVHHVIYDCPNQTATNQFVATSTTTINGDFTVKSTGSTNAIHLGGGGTSRTVNILGNLNIEGGAVIIANAGSSVAQTFNVTGNVEIASGARLTLSASTSLGASGTVGAGRLNVKGNITNSGTFGNATGSTVRISTITFNGTGAQAYTSTGLAGDSVSVTINGATTTVVTLNSDLTLAKGLFTNILGSLVISAGKYLTLGSTGSNSMCGSNTANTITLKSDATGTAGLGKVTGTLTNTSRIMVERYIPSAGRRKYVLLTSPLQSTLNDWQEAASGSTFTPGTPGYGTQITNSVAQGTNGYDGPATSGASFFTYNDDNTSGSKWVAYAGASGTNTALSLNPGVGYLLFVRGDRSEDRATTGTSSNTTLLARGSGIGNTGTGTISRGNVNSIVLNANPNKYTLIGNPYPCTINWLSSGITKTGLTNNFTVYDPNLGVFVSSDGTNVTPNTGNQQAQYIQSGQAFFVQNDATLTHSIAFTEDAKTITANTAINTTVFKNSNSTKQRLSINIFRANNHQFTDGVVALFDSKYNEDIDSNDISKFTNFAETFSLSRNNKLLGLEARPIILDNDSLFFNLANFGKREYEFVINAENFTNETAMLEDSYMNTRQVLNLTSTTKYKFTVNNDNNSFSNTRFKILFNRNANNIVDETSSIIYLNVTPNPTINQLHISFKTKVASNTIVQVLTSTGKVVKSINLGNVDSGKVTMPVSSLAKGTYMIRLWSGNKSVAVQKILKQ